MEFLFVIIALILSIVIHEVSHGYIANMLGDPTAELAGRLTLNPIRHLDPLGSVIIPGLLVITQSPFLIGWAKPVPYNPYNLSNQRWGEALVAGAGPAVNLVIALVFGFLVRFMAPTGLLSSAFIEISVTIVYINILLALFNLIPIPPLDGSKVLRSVLPYRLSYAYTNLENMMAQYGFFLMFGFIFLLLFVIGTPFFRFVGYVVSLITGMPL